MRGAIAAISALSVAGCGDALVGTDYRGDPIFKLEGRIASVGALPEAIEDASFLVSMFWVPTTTSTAERRLEPREQPSVSTNVEFPATFVLRIFEPPEDLHYASDDSSWVIGLLLVYADMDGDSVFDPIGGDQIIGGTLRRGILYARGPVEADASPNGEALEPGFTLVDLPLRCPREPKATGDAWNRDPPPPFNCDPRHPCRPGSVCDPVDRVCVAAEPLVLEIVGSFHPDRSLCGPP